MRHDKEALSAVKVTEMLFTNFHIIVGHAEVCVNIHFAVSLCSSLGNQCVVVLRYEPERVFDPWCALSTS